MFSSLLRLLSALPAILAHAPLSSGPDHALLARQFPSTSYLSSYSSCTPCVDLSTLATTCFGGTIPEEVLAGSLPPANECLCTPNVFETAAACYACIGSQRGGTQGSTAQSLRMKGLKQFRSTCEAAGFPVTASTTATPAEAYGRGDLEIISAAKASATGAPMLREEAGIVNAAAGQTGAGSRRSGAVGIVSVAVGAVVLAVGLL